MNLIEYLSVPLWVLCRAVGFVMAMPVVGTKSLPSQVKVYLAILLAAMVVLTQIESVSVGTSIPQLVLLSVWNLSIGLFIGLMASIAFQFLAFGGHLVAMGSGLGFATLADPANGTQITTLSNFYKVSGSLIFVCLGGLFALLMVLIRSFDVFPLLMEGSKSVDVEYVLRVFTFCLENGLILASPMVFAVLLMNVAFGVISKASPSLNVFSVGFPVGIWVTMFFIAGSLQFLPIFVTRYLDQLGGLVLGGR